MTSSHLRKEAARMLKSNFITLWSLSVKTDNKLIHYLTNPFTIINGYAHLQISQSILFIGIKMIHEKLMSSFFIRISPFQNILFSISFYVASNLEKELSAFFAFYFARKNIQKKVHSILCVSLPCVRKINVVIIMKKLV